MSTQTQRSRPPKLGQNRTRNTSPSAALMHQPTPLNQVAPTKKPKPAKATARTREPEIQQKSPAPPPIKRQQTSPSTPSILTFPINYSTFKCGKSCATSWLVLCIVPNLYLSLLAISFLNIKIGVNFKNLFGINFFLKFSFAGIIITNSWSTIKGLNEGLRTLKRLNRI